MDGGFVGEEEGAMKENYRAAPAKFCSSKNIQHRRRVSVRIFTEIIKVN